MASKISKQIIQKQTTKKKIKMIKDKTFSVNKYHGNQVFQIKSLTFSDQYEFSNNISVDKTFRLKKKKKFSTI